MQNKIIIVIFIIGVAISSCGKSAQDKAWEREQKNDSMGFAAIADVDKAGARQVKLKLLKAKYEKTKYDYDVARDKLRTIEEFHLARTPKMKEQEVQNQKEYIRLLDDSLQKMGRNIAGLEKRMSK